MPSIREHQAALVDAAGSLAQLMGCSYQYMEEGQTSFITLLRPTKAIVIGAKVSSAQTLLLMNTKGDSVDISMSGPIPTAKVQAAIKFLIV